jgi:hypothetical protein
MVERAGPADGRAGAQGGEGVNMPKGRPKKGAANAVAHRRGKPPGRAAMAQSSASEHSCSFGATLSRPTTSMSRSAFLPLRTFKPQQMQFLLSIKTVFPKPGGKV